MIVIRDYTTGESFGFNTDKSGYNAAASKIRELVQQGHRVETDSSSSVPMHRIEEVAGPIFGY